jgi:hypothetical protein
VRVVAAAGTGKTTTLVLIVRRLQAEAPHKRILYLVYNKEFQLQAQAGLAWFGCQVLDVRCVCGLLRSVRRHAELQSEDGDDETSVLVMMVHIIELYRDQTLLKCDNFKRAILANYRADEADVIVTTTHQAKGMEFDMVRLCDDFADLCVFEKNEAKFCLAASDVNLWYAPRPFPHCNFVTSCCRYVAVTCARSVVVLPQKFMELTCKIQETLDDCAASTGVDSATALAMSLRARAKLFHNWPLPLLVQPADVPLSPARARLVGEASTP